MVKLDGICGVIYDTYRDPDEARQFRQWQIPAIVGKEGASICMPMAPQLQAPWTLSILAFIFSINVIRNTLCDFGASSS